MIGRADMPLGRPLVNAGEPAVRAAVANVGAVLLFADHPAKAVGQVAIGPADLPDLLLTLHLRLAHAQAAVRTLGRSRALGALDTFNSLRTIRRRSLATMLGGSLATMLG
jgi:hypothetical protein